VGLSEKEKEDGLTPSFPSGSGFLPLGRCRDFFTRRAAMPSRQGATGGLFSVLAPNDSEGSIPLVAQTRTGPPVFPRTGRRIHSEGDSDGDGSAGSAGSAGFSATAAGRMISSRTSPSRGSGKFEA